MCVINTLLYKPKKKKYPNRLAGFQTGNIGLDIQNTKAKGISTVIVIHQK